MVEEDVCVYSVVIWPCGVVEGEEDVLAFAFEAVEAERCFVGEELAVHRQREVIEVSAVSVVEFKAYREGFTWINVFVVGHRHPDVGDELSWAALAEADRGGDASLIPFSFDLDLGEV